MTYNPRTGKASLGGAASGYATLDAGSLVPVAQLPTAGAAAAGIIPTTGLTNAMVAAAAAIAKTKLAALDIVNADINAAAGIVKTKLAALDIVNADINAAAGIVKTKLAALAIVNADIDAAAAIAASKLSLSWIWTALVAILTSGTTATAAGTLGRWVLGEWNVPSTANSTNSLVYQTETGVGTGVYDTVGTVSTATGVAVTGPVTKRSATWWCPTGRRYKWTDTGSAACTMDTYSHLQA